MDKSGNAILYVDDEQQNLDGFKFIFRKAYTIFSTTDVDEAFNIIKDNEIKVLISDQKMPVLTGIELIAKVNQSNPEIVCIILTAYADMEAVIQAVNLGGVYRYMMKPWEEADLRLSINSALERYSIKKENKALLEDIQLKNKELKRYNGELEETVEELQTAKEKAEESDRLKQAFLQNISHEIRTPMNGILGFADLLKTPQLDTETQHSYISTITSSGKQLMNIIENVLDVAKIEAGQVELNSRTFELNTFLDDIYSFHYLQIDETKVDFTLENPYREQNITVYSDNVKLRQILDNLLNNARKFTPSGFIKLKVVGEEDETLFIIEDSGIGIPQDKQTTVFEPFRQVENIETNVKSGTGLGLSITRSFVDLFGGNIWLQSEEGKGTQFYISLPLILTPANTKNMDLTIKTDLIFDSNKSILIVEDDDVSYNYLNTILLQMNLKTTRAISGKEAFDHLSTPDKFDLVLMDIKLPDYSGLEITKELRTQGSKLPIIAQTSYALSNIREEALRAGCDDFITKPILKRELFSAIKKHF